MKFHGLLTTTTTDIYATSLDYNRNAPTTREFFANVQNKLHFAIHGNTAAELIM
ncbi:RhuM family protein, partial [Methanoculleus sp.]|uniref:RhuM family protein n=1 Tax=Methanoculleus sp. TaxID=90427 RepID=UPI0025CB912E